MHERDRPPGVHAYWTLFGGFRKDMTELVLLSESHDCADERRGAMYGCLRQMCGVVLESIYARKSSVGVAPS